VPIEHAHLGLLSIQTERSRSGAGSDHFSLQNGGSEHQAPMHRPRLSGRVQTHKPT
jgi:hypothetical protein